MNAKEEYIKYLIDKFNKQNSEITLELKNALLMFDYDSLSAFTFSFADVSISELNEFRSRLIRLLSRPGSPYSTNLNSYEEFISEKRENIINELQIEPKKDPNS
jgi:hypothetical protein